MNKKYLILILVLAIITSCGSGTFENDSKTWSKVFNEDKPKNVEIINSRFWKSTHWTYEFEVFLEFKADKKIINKYFIKYDSLINPKKEDYHKLDNYFFDKPKWFQTKEYNDYEIWIANDKWKDTKLFIDKKTKIVYFHFSQT